MSVGLFIRERKKGHYKKSSLRETSVRRIPHFAGEDRSTPHPLNPGEKILIL